MGLKTCHKIQVRLDPRWNLVVWGSCSREVETLVCFAVTLVCFAVDLVALAHVARVLRVILQNIN